MRQRFWRLNLRWRELDCGMRFIILFTVWGRSEPALLTATQLVINGAGWVQAAEPKPVRTWIGLKLMNPYLPWVLQNDFQVTRLTWPMAILFSSVMSSFVNLSVSPRPEMRLCKLVFFFFFFQSNVWGIGDPFASLVIKGKIDIPRTLLPGAFSTINPLFRLWLWLLKYLWKRQILSCCWCCYLSAIPVCVHFLFSIVVHCAVNGRRNLGAVLPYDLSLIYRLVCIP